jgi:hypothetical protein
MRHRPAGKIARLKIVISNQVRGGETSGGNQQNTNGKRANESRRFHK